MNSLSRSGKNFPPNLKHCAHNIPMLWVPDTPWCEDAQVEKEKRDIQAIKSVIAKLGDVKKLIPTSENKAILGDWKVCYFLQGDYIVENLSV
jgi:hypothetical protein